MESLASQIARFVQELYGQTVEVTLDRPDSKFGDYATSIAMRLAKILGKNPREIAEELASRLRENSLFRDVTIAGPGFINFRVTARAQYDALSSAWSDEYGNNQDGSGKTVVVEYPSPNVAKPYSVGHLRPGNQGWAVRQLMLATGWNVITDNHLGDYGAPFGVWVVGFMKYSSDEALEKDGVYELGRVYIEARKALKEEAEAGGHEMADQVQEWLLRLESGDETALAYSKRFNEISMEHVHSIMSRLRISTDYEYGESFFVPKGKEAVKRLLSDGVAKQNDDGSVIVPLDDVGFDVPFLIQKSNGAALYATTDLATILFREETWHPDKVIYCVGAEQQYYFSQLFQVAKKLGVSTELYHLWFGVIDQIDDDGKRSKMSSRKGVVLMEELLDQAESKAREVVGGRDVSDDDIKKIALGGIKFSDFTADRRTNILFDWSTIFALTGFSGAYIQYAAVRVNKILRDNALVDVVAEDYTFDSEKQVITKLLEYPGVIRLAARELEPHKIATYLYELAREMNRYYEHTPVATPDVSPRDKYARLDVLMKVSHVFEHGLDLLGIEVPYQM